MSEQEKQRTSHLILLICYSVFLVVLTLESVLLGWKMQMIRQLWIGLGIGWVLHITQKLSLNFRKWLYFFMTMSAYVYYGTHKTSLYDCAPVIIGAIMIYYAAELYEMINYCVIVYFGVMLYDLVILLGREFEFSALSISRLLLHFLLVFAVGQLVRVMSRRKDREKEAIEEEMVELAESNQRMEDFLTNISHELRTPINAVTGLTGVMLKDEEDEGKRKHMLSVQKAGYRLFNQIEDILDYTEIDSGRVRVSEEPYMISSLVNDIVSGKELLENKKGVELIFDIDPEIPSTLIGDGRKIKKVIKHVIDNAVKFTQKGGICVRIYALRKPYGINLCIRVSDTGIGIDDDSMKKIAEKYYQSSRGRNRRASGLGLGLPLVYGIVSALGGFIQVSSEQGIGTTVSVSIPQKIQEDHPCMAIKARLKLSFACYLKPDKYEVPEVRNYYDKMIAHMAEGLDISIHKVFDVDELEKLLSVYQVTHLFMGNVEYEENSAMFEKLDPATQVVIVADPGFTLPNGSRMKVLPKPFQSFAVVSILNAETEEDIEAVKGMRMFCPGIRTLVIDDEPMNLMVAEGIFKDYGMEVQTVESGKKAIALCEREEFDLLFIDHMMPGLDGVETLKRIRESAVKTERNFKAVAFTANVVSGAREMFLEEGFDEFISKPVEYPELERVLKKLLPPSSIRFENERSARYRKDRKQENGAEPQKPETVTEEDQIARLELMGIHTRSGLSYSGNDRGFYLKVLDKFTQEFEKKEEELNKLRVQRDFDNYRIYVHSLKSSAKMAGADELSQLAKKAEDAAKEHDEAYIRSHHEELLDLYGETVWKIRDILQPDEDGEKKEPSESSGREITREELIQHIKEIRESLETFEEDRAQKKIAELEGAVYQGAPVDKMIEGLKRDVEDFEFGAASEKAEALLREWEGGES